MIKTLNIGVIASSRGGVASQLPTDLALDPTPAGVGYTFTVLGDNDIELQKTDDDSNSPDAARWTVVDTFTDAAPVSGTDATGAVDMPGSSFFGPFGYTATKFWYRLRDVVTNTFTTAIAATTAVDAIANSPSATDNGDGSATLSYGSILGAYSTDHYAIEYSVNSGSQVEGTSVSGLINGDTVDVRAKDQNIYSISEWQDGTQVVISILPSEPTFAPGDGTAFVYSGANTDTMEFRVDGGSWSSCMDADELGSDGALVEARGINSEGNGPIASTRPVSNPTITDNTDNTVTFDSISMLACTVFWRFNGGAWTEASSGTIQGFGEDGTFECYAHSTVYGTGSSVTSLAVVYVP